MSEREIQFHCILCNTPHTGPEALENLIKCWELGVPEFTWEEGQKISTNIGELEITARLIKLKDGNHIPFYELTGGKSPHKKSQEVLTVLTDAKRWKIINE